ncbi:MAG: hypothetical protein AB1489_30850 [Acidobacteriota bacterium]
MDWKSQAFGLDQRKQRSHRLGVAVCLIGALILFICAFPSQPNLRAAAAQQEPLEPVSGPLQIELESELMHRLVDKSRLLKSTLKKTSNSKQKPAIGPLAIPNGIPINNVAFFGIDRTASVMALADTDSNSVFDATENFFVSDDPNNETTASMAFSKKTGRFYIGTIAADGPRKQMGQIAVLNNSGGNYKGNKIGSFSTGRGMPIGMVVLDSPQGDVLIVATLFFSKDALDASKDDTYSITAYLPGANGFPDGTRTRAILPVNSTLANDPINLGFGGLALDSRGVLYANVASKVEVGNNVAIGGALLAFSDSDADGIPDRSSVFAPETPADVNPITASSLVAVPNPSGGTRVYAFGVNTIFDAPSQIAIYTDANSDLKSDGPFQIFYNSNGEFDGFISSFGSGTSAIELSHMDFANSQGLFSFKTVTFDGRIVDSGVALVATNPTGTADAPLRIFQAQRVNNNFDGVTLLVGVPATLQPDTQVPTVTISAPTAGQTFTGGSMATVSYSSSDNIAVVAHNILFARDGVNFNNVLAGGLAGNQQSFQFVVPQTNTTTARIRVLAIDAAGNTGMATSGAFTITAQAPDTQVPTVTVTAPVAGQLLLGGTTATVTYSSNDNVGVVSHNILLAADGANFTTTLATALPGNQQSLLFTVPQINTTTAAIRVEAVDAAGNVGRATSASFTISTQAPDTQPPTVTITSPTPGQTLNSGAMANVNFTSSDNVGVLTHNILLSPDGTNFSIPLAIGLPGNQQSFQFSVPTLNTTVAAIRVQAFDAVGNMGMATIGPLTIRNDTQNPTIRVISPNGKEKLKGGKMFNVQFMSSDDIGVVSHDIQISVDNGANFTTLANGIAGNVQSFMVTIPKVKGNQGKKSLIKVIARDAAGNSGQDVSDAPFKIKK